MSGSSKKESLDGAEMVTVDELRMAPTSDSPRKAIKSTAVVKYSAVEAPACFEQLRCNTDLNEPPSNWLSPKSCGGIHHGLSNNSGFSSFRMAHMFPDCVGEVDVVSDAENIKKLLKIPYSKGPVSMMVHRVENTLLIDEFDVHKHLLRTSEWDWRWLRSFFFEHVLNTLSCKDKGLYQKGTSRGALQQRSLVSKFLYHSIGSEGVMAEEGEGSEPTTSSSPPPEQTSQPTWATLPEPQPVLPDTKSANHEFARNLLWTFEDIQMLIGTDMPIFGGSTHPCISLRLRDMNKPISVLTGIDYWLDNLMCNVPEVVMCYHLDGIVQKYELVKTEDLPHLEDSKFSPKLIHDVAQNILSFLKSNATKAGHTYWLFKGKDDDAVKLYDLSSLCGEDIEEQGQNPFTVPVAILLYRVARNMKQQGSTQLGCIRTLLQNCVSLLDKEKHPQIVTSAHYMLSDLYVPAETNPSKPELPEDQGDDEEVDEDEMLDRELEQTGETSVEVQSLVLTDSVKNIRTKCHLFPLCGSNTERCREALKHVAQGLQCLRLLDTRMWHKDEEKSTSKEEEEPKMAHPFQPIPMPYTEPTKESLAVLTTHEKEVIKGSKEKTDSENNWTGHLLTLLYEKALLVLAILVQESLGSGNFGTVLTQVQSVLNLLSGLKKLANLLGIKNGRYKEMAALRSILLGQAGDACSIIVQKWYTVQQFRDEMSQQDPEVNIIFEQLEVDVGPQEDPPIVSSSLESMQDVLRSGVNVYKLALEGGPSADTEASLRRRLGNAHNELGVLYMSLATSKLTEGEKSEFESLVRQSLGELQAGIVAFQRVADNGNLALLLSNTGRLMRLCAHALSKSSGSTLGVQERGYYTKAVNYYQDALSTLGTRKSTENCAIWDSVSWELSTTLFNMAATLQDYPNCQDKSQEQLEREVGDALQRALQACDLETPGPRLPVYQFRAATLHHRLASLHHSSYRQLSGEDPRRKFALQLCRLHYEKSANMLKSLEDHTEHLRVNLERLALAEFIAEGSNNVNLRRKNLHAGLELLVACESAVKGLTSSQSSDTREEELRLLRLLEQRLQCLLLSMAKLTAPPTTSKTTKNKENASSNYKAMYAVTLHRADTANPEDVPSLASRLAIQLRRISELLDNK